MFCERCKNNATSRVITYIHTLYNPTLSGTSFPQSIELLCDECVEKKLKFVKHRSYITCKVEKLSEEELNRLGRILQNDAEVNWSFHEQS